MLWNSLLNTEVYKKLRYHYINGFAFYVSDLPSKGGVYPSNISMVATVDDAKPGSSQFTGYMSGDRD